MSSLTTSIIDINIPIVKQKIKSGSADKRNNGMFNEAFKKTEMISMFIVPEIRKRARIKTNLAVTTASTGI